MADLHCDVLVIGAGMAGLAAAARATELGAHVVVIEAADAVGGSAAISGGYLWTASDLDGFRGEEPDGDPALARLITDRFLPDVDWIRSRGVAPEGPIPVLHGTGYRFDVARHLRSCVVSVESASGHVLLGCSVERLLVDASGSVVGARVHDASDVVDIEARSTILATGGFQGDRELLRTRVSARPELLHLRSNPCSRGDGMRLGTSVGAVASDDNHGFYGHLVPFPGPLESPELFRPLSQYHSSHSLLFDQSGERFLDESRGDHWNAQAVAALPSSTALLVWDEGVQQDHVLQPYIHGHDVEDKARLAMSRGAHCVILPSLEAVADAVDPWGYAGRRMASSVHEYNAVVERTPESLEPGRSASRRQLTRAPFYAMEVAPAITFTYAGLRINDRCQALQADGGVVPGLLVAGADVGDVYRAGYCGGLALALVTGVRAAETACPN
jgi:succinate dehydrogenase/fumarate reductase flavoprotein subunit